jgi:hypothetical protein
MIALFTLRGGKSGQPCIAWLSILFVQIIERRAKMPNIENLLHESQTLAAYNLF